MTYKTALRPCAGPRCQGARRRFVHVGVCNLDGRLVRVWSCARCDVEGFGDRVVAYVLSPHGRMIYVDGYPVAVRSATHLAHATYSECGQL